MSRLLKVIVYTACFATLIASSYAAGGYYGFPLCLLVVIPNSLLIGFAASAIVDKIRRVEYVSVRQTVVVESKPDESRGS